MSKIAVIGAGQVGATTAYTLAVSGLAEEIAVVDLNEALARGVAADVAHGMPFCAPVRLCAGDYGAAEGADMVIMTAGAAQRPGETRRELIGRNRGIMESAGRSIARAAPNSVLVVVSNPLDVLTTAAAEVTGFPESRVFGSGTVLDTARLKALLSAHTGVDARDVSAWVLGEHGDSEFVAWSLTRIAGQSVEDYCRLCGRCDSTLPEALRAQFDDGVRSAAYAVIEQKGATCYAIALAVRRICQAVLRDEKSILTVSVPAGGRFGVPDAALSLPCVVGRSGVERVLEVSLSPEEERLLRQSAEVIRENGRA